MARSLPSFPIKKLSFLPIPITFFFALIAMFGAFSLVTLLCASHKRAKSQSSKREQTAVQLGDQKHSSKLRSNISSKALGIAKAVSWKKTRVEEEKDDDHDFTLEDEEAMWRKEIMMGEKCRPLDFSGKILYDSQGNLIPSSPPGSHTIDLVSVDKS